MIARLGRFAVGSYPPLAVLLVTVWAFGQSALFGALDPRVAHWRPGGGTVIAAVTLVVDLLLMRALDDIRDLDYDRRHNPRRPLASGAVRTRDLLVLCVAGAGALLLLNAWDAASCVVLAVQFGYVALAMLVYRKWRLPSADNVVTSLCVSLPAPLLAQAYLYARFLHAERLSPARSGAIAVLIVLLARLHAEFARKVVRDPAADERTYVHHFGFTGTVAAALGTAVAATAVLLWAAPWPWALLGLVPLRWALEPAWRLRRADVRRWPRSAPGNFLLAAFAVCFVIGVLK